MGREGGASKRCLLLKRLNLIFQKEELDLIWSEGAIYNIGFENTY